MYELPNQKAVNNTFNGITRRMMTLLRPRRQGHLPKNRHERKDSLNSNDKIWLRCIEEDYKDTFFFSITINILVSFLYLCYLKDSIK